MGHSEESLVSLDRVTNHLLFVVMANVPKTLNRATAAKKIVEVAVETSFVTLEKTAALAQATVVLAVLMENVPPMKLAARAPQIVARVPHNSIPKTPHKSAQPSITAPLVTVCLIAIAYTWIAVTNRGYAALDSRKYPILAACSSSEYFNIFDSDSVETIREVMGLPESGSSPIPGFDINDKPDLVDIWADIYHTVVDEIIEHHMGNDPSVSPYDAAPKCEEPDIQFNPPGDVMLLVAQNLPAWEAAVDLGRLSEDDFASVLLELLTAYECSLWERRFHLSPVVIDEEWSWRKFLAGGNFVDFINPPNIFRLDEEISEQRGKIDNELLTARPALQRALIIAGGYGRLARLDKELQCIQRASLDYRNVFAVVAETSSCLPRNWGAKDPLRDTRYLFN